MAAFALVTFTGIGLWVFYERLKAGRTIRMRGYVVLGLCLVSIAGSAYAAIRAAQGLRRHRLKNSRPPSSPII